MKEKLFIATPASSLLKAISLAKPNKFKLENLQRIINFVTVLPSIADFRNEEAITKEIITYAKQFSGENKNATDNNK